MQYFKEGCVIVKTNTNKCWFGKTTEKHGSMGIIGELFKNSWMNTHSFGYRLANEYEEYMYKNHKCSNINEI